MRVESLLYLLRKLRGDRARAGADQDAQKEKHWILRCRSDRSTTGAAEDCQLRRRGEPHSDRSLQNAEAQVLERDADVVQGVVMGGALQRNPDVVTGLRRPNELMDGRTSQGLHDPVHRKLANGVTGTGKAEDRLRVCMEFVGGDHFLSSLPKRSATAAPRTSASSMASITRGSLNPRSMLTMVCRLTLSFLARASCDRPAFCRYSRRRDSYSTIAAQCKREPARMSSSLYKLSLPLVGFSGTGAQYELRTARYLTLLCFEDIRDAESHLIQGSTTPSPTSV